MIFLLPPPPLPRQASNLVDSRLPRIQVLVVLHQSQVYAKMEGVGGVGGPAQQSEQFPPQRLLGCSRRRKVRPRDGLYRQYLGRDGRSAGSAVMAQDGVTCKEGRTEKPKRGKEALVEGRNDGTTDQLLAC